MIVEWQRGAEARTEGSAIEMYKMRLGHTGEKNRVRYVQIRGKRKIDRYVIVSFEGELLLLGQCPWFVDQIGISVASLRPRIHSDSGIETSLLLAYWCAIHPEETNEQNTVMPSPVNRIARPTLSISTINAVCRMFSI